MNDNVLTSYSFLAALSENETDIYKTVYLPYLKGQYLRMQQRNLLRYQIQFKVQILIYRALYLKNMVLRFQFLL